MGEVDGERRCEAFWDVEVRVFEVLEPTRDGDGGALVAPRDGDEGRGGDLDWAARREGDFSSDEDGD